MRCMFLQANIDMLHVTNEKKLQEKKMGKWFSKPLYRKLVQRCIGREYSCEKRMKLSIYSSSTFNDPSMEEEEEMKQVVSANIPNDVLVDMLSRFPARALMRLKCVSKNWRSVIQDPVFVNLHLTLAKETGMGLIQTLEDTGFRIYSIDDFGFATELHSLVTDNSYPHVPSCNSLLCFLDNSDDMLSFPDNSKEIRIRLCNPITGETFTITKPYCFQRKTAGLGYDTCSQKYKIVCCSESEVDVYTVGSEFNSWRTIICPSGFSINFLEKPIYSHGNLHWKASISDHANGSQQCAIVALDMSDENFSLVKGPDINTMNGTHWLCELEGSLSLVQAYDKKVILWVLKDYEEQVWMKKSVYRLPFYPSWPEGFMTIRNNKILFESHEDECDYVCHYDEQGQLLKVIKVTGLPSSFKNYIDNHVESLVSFKYT